jgi:hypothetical protein
MEPVMDWLGATRLLRPVFRLLSGAIGTIERRLVRSGM